MAGAMGGARSLGVGGRGMSTERLNGKEGGSPEIKEMDNHHRSRRFVIAGLSKVVVSISVYLILLTNEICTFLTPPPALTTPPALT